MKPTVRRPDPAHSCTMASATSASFGARLQVPAARRRSVVSLNLLNAPGLGWVGRYKVLGKLSAPQTKRRLQETPK